MHSYIPEGTLPNWGSIDTDAGRIDLNNTQLQCFLLMGKFLNGRSGKEGFDALVSIGMFEASDGTCEYREEYGESTRALQTRCLIFQDKIFDEACVEDEENARGITDEKKLKLLRKATQLQSLESQLAYATNVKYKAYTTNSMVRKFLIFLEEFGHESFVEPGWSGEQVYQMWSNISENRARLLKRFCAGDDNTYSITPKHCELFLNACVTKDLVVQIPEGDDIDENACREENLSLLTHGSALRHRTGETTHLHALSPSTADRSFHHRTDLSATKLICLHVCVCTIPIQRGKICPARRDLSTTGQIYPRQTDLSASVCMCVCVLRCKWLLQRVRSLWTVDVHEQPHDEWSWVSLHFERDKSLPNVGTASRVEGPLLLEDGQVSYHVKRLCYDCG